MAYPGTPISLMSRPSISALAVVRLPTNCPIIKKVTSDMPDAVRGADFLYTDVWLSMGEPPDEWDQRIDQLLPYQVNARVFAATGNPAVRFMHCLPALHYRDSEIGQQIYDKRGLEALEVTDEVFESPASIVFEQAENRLHTIKATLLATIPPPAGASPPALE